VQVVATVSIEGGDSDSLWLMIIGSKLSQEKLKWLIVLLVRHIGMEVLLQNNINMVHLVISLRMKYCE
jgi:hypothetical protein